ncbi:MAG: hypothetical protein LBH59_08125 [Planctomycetaceae bacterium]|jgi:hypothetical protein|nr:hypothetical protein [Planctomycetaceae bacterium]
MSTTIIKTTLQTKKHQSEKVQNSKTTSVTWESLPHEVQLAIENCDQDIAADRLYSTEEVFEEIDKWLEKN